MSLVSNLSSLVSRISTEFRSIRTLISGSATGNVAGLETNATDLVGAINEVREVAIAAADIDDSAASAVKVYSSAKTNAQISAAVNGLIDQAPGTLDTLGEIAAAFAQDQSGLAALTTVVNTKAATTYVDQQDASIRADYGDHQKNFVSEFESALAFVQLFTPINPAPPPPPSAG